MSADLLACASVLSGDERGEIGRLPSEDEVIQNWVGEISKPIVSICCITYNHALFVEKAMNSFLMQKTDFPFEILVHDDASTDATQAIIQKYANLYPRLIKPILQCENKFSKGIRVNHVFNVNRARGEFAAFCEGDDFWVSSLKLQSQVAIMRRHQEINISFHPSYKFCDGKIDFNHKFSDYGDHYQLFSANDVVVGGGAFMPTASLMIRLESAKNFPEWFFKSAPVGDFYTQILASLPNGALYLPGEMAAYRVNHAGSWSESQSKVQLGQIISCTDNHLYCLNMLSLKGVTDTAIAIAVSHELVEAAIKCLKSGYYREGIKYFIRACIPASLHAAVVFSCGQNFKRLVWGVLRNIRVLRK